MFMLEVDILRSVAHVLSRGALMAVVAFSRCSRCFSARCWSSLQHYLLLIVMTHAKRSLRLPHGHMSYLAHFIRRVCHLIVPTTVHIVNLDT